MIVVDASIAVKWFLHEADSDKALKLIENHQDFIAPDLIQIEVAAAFTKAARIGTIEPAYALDLCRAWYQALAEGAVKCLSVEGDFLEATRLSVEYTHPLQDCLYIVLAKRLAIPLVSADKKLITKAKECGVDILDF